MKGRDLLILSGVLLLGGFAVADVLRDTATSDPREAQPSDDRRPRRPRRRTNEATQRFPAVRGAGGDLVFTEVGACAVREVDLPTGLEFLQNVVQAPRVSCGGRR